MENNRVTISGIVEPLMFEYQRDGEVFYKTTITTNRISGTDDKIPVLVSHKLINNYLTEGIELQKTVTITGEFRSRNVEVNNKSALQLYVFAQNIVASNQPHSNEIYLEGFVCKPPIYRETPLGKNITDLFIAINRKFGKSDYIPIITWSRNAVFAQNLNIGDKVSVLGRVQSRQYIKKYSDNTNQQKVAYEVSAININILENV